MYQFKASPYPGENSVQRAVIFGDMGKVEFAVTYFPVKITFLFHLNHDNYCDLNKRYIFFFFLL